VVDLAFWQLPTKTFHLTRVRAQGVRYLFRHRVHDTDGIERRLALYPKIPGYSDPPLFEGPERPPLSDANYNLWTIHLENVDAAVKELWLLEYRFIGRGRAKGGFRLQPQRDARTDLCSFTLDGVLRAGTRTVASKLNGRIEAQLDRHDPRRVTGAQVFKKISFDIDVAADLPNLDFTRLYESAKGPHLRRGAGVMQVRAKLSHGAWQAATALSYATKGITVSRAQASVAGALNLDAKIIQPGTDSVWQLSAATRRLVLSFEGSAKGIEGPRARDVRVVLAGSADLTRPIRLTALDARLKLDASDLRWLNYPLDSKGLFGNGSAGANATLRWSEGKVAQGDFAVEAKDAVFGIPAPAIRVTGSVGAQLSYDPGNSRGNARRLAIELPEVAVAVRHAWKPLLGGVQVHSEHLTWQGFPPGHIRSRFELNTDSIKSLVPLVIPSDLLRGLALVIFDLGKTHAIVEVDRTAAALEMRVAQAQSGAVRAAGILKKENNDHDACGWFFINSASLNVGLVMQAGSTSVKPFVRNSWWRERPTTLLVCEPSPTPSERLLSVKLPNKSELISSNAY
jgi:hypothetical protein